MGYVPRRDVPEVQSPDLEGLRGPRGAGARPRPRRRALPVRHHRGAAREAAALAQPL